MMSCATAARKGIQAVIKELILACSKKAQRPSACTASSPLELLSTKSIISITCLHTHIERSIIIIIHTFTQRDEQTQHRSVAANGLQSW